MSEKGPQVFFGGSERRRGRPRAAEPGSTLSIWLPASKHDQIVRVARQHGLSVSEFVGRVLTRRLTSGRPQ